MVLAWFFDKVGDRINRIPVLMGALGIAFIPLILVFKEPDLSTSLVILAIVAAILFSSKLSWRYIVPGLVLAAILVVIVFLDALSGDPKLLGDYQADRILAWLHPEDYQLTIAYQSIQSRTAIVQVGFMA